MDSKKVLDTAKRHVPKQHKLKNTLIAFVSGGILAILAQLLFMLFHDVWMIKKASAVSMVIVTIIISASICTGLGVYDKLAQKCGAGLFVPISGFANSLTSCALEGKSEGFIYGIGGNMFKLAGSVLTYGITAAFVFGLIRFLLFGA